MVQSSKKLFFLGLVACAGGLYAYLGTVARAEGSETSKILQPQGLNHSGIYALRRLDPSLTGMGVRYGVVSRSVTYIDGQPQNDYRPSVGHNCFEGRQFGFYDDGKLPGGVSAHSTAICSILLGEEADAFYPSLGGFHYQGVAPAAEADIYEFWHFITDYVFGHSPPDVDIMTASVGSPFEDWWTRGIDSLAEHYGLIVVAGIGNGSDAQDPPLFPGASANVIGVGVVDSVDTENLVASLSHFALAYPEHSSFGPTADGRCKPDIVAPGHCLAAETGEPNGYQPTGNWASFSTPIVAGTIGLLVQKAKHDPNLNPAVSPKGGNCVIKAILLNSAKKLPYWHKGRLEKSDDHQAPLDHVQGAGMLNSVGAYKHLIAGLTKPGAAQTTGWDNNLLDKVENAESVYRITVTEPANKMITATVAWNKHYDYVCPFKAIPEKDSNLRLEVWAVDANDPNNDYLLDYSDSSTDNVEHIYCRADANYTNYEIVLLANVDGPSQGATSERYGLAWNVSEEAKETDIFLYDLNADGIVNGSDIEVLFGNWGSLVTVPGSYFLGDISGNGEFDVNDVLMLWQHKDDKADWYKD
ncbi:MAG: S8 family serine peptidase [Planctomycetota bacterium]|jgi:hypothetical protein